MYKIVFLLYLLLLVSYSAQALKGIDVSYHNGEIDFTKVKTQVDFVIMRAGYGTKDEDSKEVKFETYYAEAKKNMLNNKNISPFSCKVTIYENMSIY